MYYTLCIIIVIVLIYYVSWRNTNSYEDYLYGFWIAEDDDFCDEADVDSIMLFVGESSGWYNKSRTCYLIIMNDICNQGITLNYHSGWCGLGLGKYKIAATAVFDECQIWDEDVNIIVDMSNGCMHITDMDDKVYAVLHKQHEVTNSCRGLAAAELVE